MRNPLTSRRSDSPTAIGRMPPSSFLSVVSGAPASDGAKALGTRPFARILKAAVGLPMSPVLSFMLVWYIDRGLYGYYGYSRINVGHVWALEHCVATGILATTDYTCTKPD